MTRKEIIANIRGIFVPSITPFNGRGDVDVAAFRRNLRSYTKRDIGGVIVLGSTGEAPYLTEREKLRLLDAARLLIRPPQLLLAGTGLEGTRQTIRLSREAVARGADALLVLTPAYFKPRMDAAALTTHYQTVADALPRPVLIYSIPQYTGVHLEVGTIARLSRHGNIVGLKESSGSAQFLRAILRRADSQFRVLAGSGLALLEALQAGGAGGVMGSSNYIPDLAVEVHQNFARGEVAGARNILERIIPMIREINVRCGVAGVKYAADLCGFRGGAPRPPLLPLRPSERRIVSAALKKARIPLTSSSTV